MGEGLDLQVGGWIVTTGGEVGRVKEIAGDHVVIVVPTVNNGASATKEIRVTPESIARVGR
jgi:preprotein translocase subunit YajC